ncbi:hypothetical protein BH09ACT6_BH09ACT6_17580 [soil metagenome]
MVGVHNHTYEPDDVAFEAPFVPAPTPDEPEPVELEPEELVPDELVPDEAEVVEPVLLAEPVVPTLEASLAVDAAGSLTHNATLVAPAAIRLATPTVTVTRPARLLPCSLTFMASCSFCQEQPAPEICTCSLRRL